MTALKATEEARKNEERAVEVEKSSLTVKKNLEEELEAKVVIGVMGNYFWWVGNLQHSEDRHAHIENAKDRACRSIYG